MRKREGVQMGEYTEGKVRKREDAQKGGCTEGRVRKRENAQNGGCSKVRERKRDIFVDCVEEGGSVKFCVINCRHLLAHTEGKLPFIFTLQFLFILTFWLFFSKMKKRKKKQLLYILVILMRSRELLQNFILIL
jgi:hypothetical protein